MSFSDHEIVDIYSKQADQQIIELNKVIIALRAKIEYLERELEERDKIPIPPTVIKQIIELEGTIAKLKGDIKFYKKHVPHNVIINRENKNKPVRSGGLR